MPSKTAFESFTRARISLLKTHPFWAALSLKLEPVFTTDVDIASTDGRKIYINPHYAERADENLMRYVIYHETAHCAYGHLWRMGNRDAYWWNIASDIQIHLVGLAEKFRVDDRVIEGIEKLLRRLVKRSMESFRDCSAEKTYDILVEALKKKRKKPTHDDASRACACGDKCFEKPAPGDGGADALAHEWQAAIEEAATLVGSSPGSLKELIRPAGKTRVDWRTLLAEFFTRSISEEPTWVPPNRRFVHAGQYLPSSTHVQIGEIAIALDTSGSISKKMLESALAEINSLRATFRCSVHLFQADAATQSYAFFDEYEPLPEMVEVCGRGGTSFNPPFFEIENRGITPQLFVYFTDGFGEVSVSTPPYPVLWVFLDGGGRTEFNPPFGQAIIVDAENQQ